MRLRQIKIAGFKSFADPVHIEIRDAMTAIVGPNGCGKSNIIDAVRWVIGEGRVSELRSSNSMAGLIFSGSSGRAQLGRASVELVLDNSDHQVKGPWGQYEELSVRRVVTLDGTSAYYINHQQVRRRDVQEIFLGTGLGARSYAIISQGMVTNFIKARPEELRVYLEEAAGVSLYKERRRETENLLKSTNENLARSEDLQSVRKEEAERLRAEAAQAAKWQELDRRKTQSESLWYFLQHEQARTESDRARAEVARIENEIARRRAAIAELEAGAHAIEEAVRTADARHQNASEAFRASEKELARLEGEMSRIVERRRAAEKSLADAEAARAQKVELAETLRRQIEKAEEKAAQLAESLEVLEEQTALREEAIEEAESAEDASRAKSEAADKTLAAARTQAAVAEAAFRAARERTAELERRMGKLESAAEAEKGTPRPDEASLAALGEALSEARMREEETAALQEEAAANTEEAREAAQEANEVYFAELAKLKAVSAKLDALEDIQKQALESDALAEWVADQGLSDLPELISELEIEEGWVTAAEAVLEHRARAYLLRDLRSAAGFARTRPPARLSFAAPAAFSPDAKPHPEWRMKRLESCITSRHPAAAAALASWGSGIGLAETLDEALAVRAEIPEGCAVVTRQGDIVTAASVTFWAAEDPRLAILSREREMAALRQETERLDAAAAEADDARTEAQEREKALRQQTEALAHEAREASRRAAQLALEERDARSAWEAWKRREEDARRSRAELAQELELAQGRAEEALAQAETLAETFDRAESEAAAAQAEHSRRRDRLADLKREAESAQHRAAIARLERQQAAENERDARRRLAEADADRAREEARIAEARAVLNEGEHARLESGTAELLEKNARLEAEASAALQALEAARQAKEAHQERLRTENAEILPLTESAGNFRVEAEQKAGLLTQFNERLDELGADRQALAVLAQERGVKPGTVRNEVTRLMNEIAALGPVNHAAVAHLEAAEEAIQLAEAQMNDLRQAIETLEAAIRKIDAETRSLLRATFEKVNAHFSETFRGLFGGGQAALRMEGDEILSAGVEITAQPPGKRNASVKQLSGGEQALTATALVFAMFKLNPAPFCLLDEVDAPLDEANQGRLARLCTEMSAATQFIIITHHRVTMEYASALIGVTMKEPGVSRVVSVDIAEAAEYTQSGEGG